MELISDKSLAQYKTKEGDTIAVALTPLPGEDMAWLAHFQMGRRGGSKDTGFYVSRRCYLTGVQAAAIITHWPRHIRSIRPTSATIYQLLAHKGPISWDSCCLQNWAKTSSYQLPVKHSDIELAGLGSIDSYRLLMDWILNIADDDVDSMENSSFNPGISVDVNEALAKEGQELKKEIILAGLMKGANVWDTEDNPEDDVFH